MEGDLGGSLLHVVRKVIEPFPDPFSFLFPFSKGIFPPICTEVLLFYLFEDFEQFPGHLLGDAHARIWVETFIKIFIDIS